MITEIVGDLLVEFEEGRVSVIVHQANCFCTMGSGIARAIREKYPQAYEADCRTEEGDKEKLGTFSAAKVGNYKYIVNLYSQFTFSSKERETSYDAMVDGLIKIRKVLEKWVDKGEKPVLGIPYQIGCGLGGGSWSIVKAIIVDVFCEASFDIVIVKLPGLP